MNTNYYSPEDDGDNLCKECWDEFVGRVWDALDAAPGKWFSEKQVPQYIARVWDALDAAPGSW